MSTLLSYSLLPPSVFVSSTNDLKLIATNPLGADPITFSIRPADEIEIDFPVGTGADDLVAQLDFSCGDVSEGFTCTKVGDKFKITAVIETTLYPGDNIQVTFRNVHVNLLTGTATVGFTEYIGEAVNDGSATVTKQKQSLAVIAWLDPSVVGLGEKAPLNFQSYAATTVKIAGFPSGTGEQSFPPPFGSVDVGVGSDTQAQRSYTITAWAGANQSVPVTAVLSQNPPYIQLFTPEDKTIRVDDQITLAWKYLYGNRLILTRINGDLNNPSSPTRVSPGRDVTDVYNMESHNVNSMPDTIDYTLIIQGFDMPAKHKVTFKLKPVELVYLKFADPELTWILPPQVSPMSWSQWIWNGLPNNGLKLTIHQPGGKADEYFLDTTDKVNPQIQYFAVVNSKLSWITANLKSMTLNPGNISIPAADIAKGTHDIPAGATEVILTAVGNNGKPVRSVLRTSAMVPASHARFFAQAAIIPTKTQKK